MHEKMMRTIVGERQREREKGGEIRGENVEETYKGF